MADAPQIFPLKKFWYHDGRPRLPCGLDIVINDDALTYSELLACLNYSLYFHFYYNILLIQSDTIHMQVNEMNYTLRRNDLILFAPQDFHRYYADEGESYCRWDCEFSYEYIEPFLVQNEDVLRCFAPQNNAFCPIRHLDEATARELSDALSAMRALRTSEEYGSDTALRCALMRLLVRINHLFSSLPANASGTVRDDYKKLTPILKYINSHLAENLSLNALSQRFYISKFHLCRLFKKTLGYTINEYITFRRVSNVAALLRQGYSVTQACEAVTPEGVSHFIATFKKLVGVTPKQFSKQY